MRKFKTPASQMENSVFLGRARLRVESALWSHVRVVVVSSQHSGLLISVVRVCSHPPEPPRPWWLTGLLQKCFVNPRGQCVKQVFCQNTHTLPHADSEPLDWLNVCEFRCLLVAIRYHQSQEGFRPCLFFAYLLHMKKSHNAQQWTFSGCKL